MLPFTKNEKKIATVCGGKTWGGGNKKIFKNLLFWPKPPPLIIPHLFLAKICGVGEGNGGA